MRTFQVRWRLHAEPDSVGVNPGRRVRLQRRARAADARHHRRTSCRSEGCGGQRPCRTAEHRLSGTPARGRPGGIGSARGGRAGGAAARGAAPQARQTPPREQWYAEPVKVFDNLVLRRPDRVFRVGGQHVGRHHPDRYVFDYSVEAEVVDGLKKLGLIRHDQVRDCQPRARRSFRRREVSPGSVRDADHHGRARLGDGRPQHARPRAEARLVASDGQKLTLGDTTLTLFLTPGHTPGTISTLIPVKDNGRPHLMAAWGGTAFNFPRTPENFKIYIHSAQKFRDIVAKAGADGVIANHTNFDGTKVKAPALAKRCLGRAASVSHWQCRCSAISDGCRGVREGCAAGIESVEDAGAPSKDLNHWTQWTQKKSNLRSVSLRITAIFVQRAQVDRRVLDLDALRLRAGRHAEGNCARELRDLSHIHQ